MDPVKISELPPITSVQGNDILPIVHTPTTYNVTKTNFLTGATGEPIQLTGDNGGFISIASSGDVTIYGSTAGSCTIGNVSHNVIVIGGTGGLTMIAGNDKGILIEHPGTSDSKIHFTTGGIDLIGNAGTINIEYKPGTPGDWSPAPTDMATAIDRIAALLVVVTGSPVP